MAKQLFCFECACRQDHREVERDVFACVACGRRSRVILRMRVV